MNDSIVVNMKYANYDMITGIPNVERHHIFGGANRAKSDVDGLWVPLSKEHHTGKMSVHMNLEMRVLMHIIGQLAWELHQVSNEEDREKAREAFRKRYGKSYL
jgi:hypothetical protein